MKAYVLIKFDADADFSKATHAMNEPGIESLDFVLGEFDAIARVRADDLSALGHLAAKIRQCPGIQDSITCPVVTWTD